MSAEERVSRFGLCLHACRPVEFLPEAALAAALERVREADPVGIGTMWPRQSDADGVVYQHDWSGPGNRWGDPLGRTSLFFGYDADHLMRLSANRRGDFIAELRDWPRHRDLKHPVTFVLVGTPALAEAVAACGAVRRIDLPAMALDGIAGTFGQVCRLVFGTRDPHRASAGAIGPLLTLARLQGREPPFCINDGELLRLPSPDRG